jgi:hypothetical protein
MKHMNIVISAIVIAAVLIAAYAVGLLVRHARTHNDQSGSLAASIAEDAALQAKAGQQAPGSRRPHQEGPTPEQVRQQREQLLEKMKTMTEEEKRKYTEEEVRKRFGTGDRGPSRKLSPQERERLMQKRRQMLPSEKKPLVEETQPPASGSDPNAVPKTPAQTSELNKAGEG